jgi:hypothetical protein
LAADLSQEDIEKVLWATLAHERAQKRFLECASFLRAYASGGEHGVHLLNKLHESIIAYFGMQDEK